LLKRAYFLTIIDDVIYFAKRQNIKGKDQIEHARSFENNRQERFRSYARV